MGALFKALAKAEDPLGFPRKGRLYPHAVAKPFIQSLGLALTLCAKRRGDHRGKTGSCRDLWIETRFSVVVRSLGLYRIVPFPSGKHLAARSHWGLVVRVNPIRKVAPLTLVHDPIRSRVSLRMAGVEASGSTRRY